MKALILIIVIVGQTIVSQAQKSREDKFNGYVITTDNQMKDGYLKLEVGFKDRGTRIALYKTPRSKPDIFYSLELKEYAFKKDTFKIFRNVKPFDNEGKVIDIVEAKRISSGKLDVYEIPEYSSTLMVISTNSGGMGTVNAGSVSYIYIIIDKQGHITGIKKENFKQKISEILNDRQDIVDKINSGELKFKHIGKIFSQYNK